MSITRPITSAGKMLVGFASGLWSASSGSPSLTQSHTGYDSAGNKTGITSRTGQPEMLKWVQTSDTKSEIVLASPASNLTTQAIAGRFGLWVYVENMPGHEPGGTLKGQIGVTLTNSPSGAPDSGLNVGFTYNQVREGWNFLRFVMRNPTAYVQSSGVTEYHPHGVLAKKNGDGSRTDILNGNVTAVWIDVQNLNGATLYFDSIWTGFTSQAQIVLGSDSGAVDLQTYGIPDLAAKGWKGYVAAPMRLWGGGTKIVTDATATSAAQYLSVAHAAGWEIINHTVNHLPGTLTTPGMGTLTDAAQIAYEINFARGFYKSHGLTRGQEFYASPQSQTSRLAEKVIKDCGIVLQRHARKWNTTVTQFGVDNLHHIGAIDLGAYTYGAIGQTTSGAAFSTAGFQQYSSIKKAIDVLEAYGDTGFLFWHVITILGDSGSGEDLTGDDIRITHSAFTKTLDYLQARETAGGLRVTDGITGFFYGSGR